MPQNDERMDDLRKSKKISENLMNYFGANNNAIQVKESKKSNIKSCSIFKIYVKRQMMFFRNLRF